jgi:hypothetical protein
MLCQVRRTMRRSPTRCSTNRFANSVSWPPLLANNAFDVAELARSLITRVLLMTRCQ